MDNVKIDAVAFFDSVKSRLDAEKESREAKEKLRKARDIERLTPLHGALEDFLARRPLLAVARGKPVQVSVELEVREHGPPRVILWGAPRYTSEGRSVAYSFLVADFDGETIECHSGDHGVPGKPSLATKDWLEALRWVFERIAGSGGFKPASEVQAAPAPAKRKKGH